MSNPILLYISLDLVVIQNDTAAHINCLIKCRNQYIEKLC